METSHPNIKYDWYQSETHVVISVLVKQLKPENVRVELVNSKLSCYAKLPDASDYYLHLNLAHGVSAQDMKHKVLGSKVEIRVKKTDVSHWNELLASEEEVRKREENIRRYPSSKQPRDWDALVNVIKQEEKNEKPEGEEALNQLFQRIYADGSDETKKAMNKSFMESGGTVLSTSWNEVSQRKIEVKPPDGVEWKTWDS